MSDLKEPLIAVYAVDRWIRDRQDLNVGEVVDFLKKHNVNAVFGGYDNASFREACRAAGIKVFVDLVCFHGKQHWESHPDSHPVTFDGEPMKPQGWYHGVDPSQRWLQEELIEKACRIVREHDVDGVWLDFIRFPARWEVEHPDLFMNSFTEASLDSFTLMTGIVIPDRESKTKKQVAAWILENYYSDWVDWKCMLIASFVKELSDAVKAEKSGVLVGLFGVPWRDNEVVDDCEGAIRNIVGQDFKLLAEHGVDVFSPMVYHLLCYRDVAWISDTTNYFKAQTGKPVVPIIQACSEPRELTNEEFTASIEHALQSPSSGVIIFHASYLEKEGKWESFREAVREH